MHRTMEFFLLDFLSSTTTPFFFIYTFFFLFFKLGTCFSIWAGVGRWEHTRLLLLLLELGTRALIWAENGYRMDGFYGYRIEHGDGMGY